MRETPRSPAPAQALVPREQKGVVRRFRRYERHTFDPALQRQQYAQQACRCVVGIAGDRNAAAVQGRHRLPRIKRAGNRLCHRRDAEPGNRGCAGLQTKGV